MFMVASAYGSRVYADCREVIVEIVLIESVVWGE